VDFHTTILIEISLNATNIAIATIVLWELAQFHQSFVKVAFGAAVIDDIFGMIVLSI
jgi:Kef-type K+ transport system membrane component KefB